MTFQELCKLEPRLDALYFETQFLAGKVSRVDGIPGRGYTKPNHCKMMEWHGVPQERGQIGMKWFLQKIAADNPLVAQHWDLCYHTLHDALPACSHEDACRYDFPVPPVSQEMLDAGWQIGKRNLRRGFASITEQLHHAAGTGPEPVWLDKIEPIKDATEPIFFVRSAAESTILRERLKLDERVAAKEISLWYAARAVSVVDEEKRAKLKAAATAAHSEERDFNPIVLCFPDSELVAALKRAGFVATCLDEIPESLEQVRNNVQLAMPIIDSGLNDMPKAVLDGWLGEVCRTRMADFPRAYAWPALLATASVLVPRETESRVNLYVATVGQPGTGKTQAFKRAAWLLSLNEPALLELKAGSAEGMAATLEAANGASRLLFPDELGHLLEKAQIENASFPYILNTAFYEDVQHLTVSRRKEIKFNARLSLAGGVVDDRFDAVFGNTTTGGLYDRFLFGLCPADAVYLYRPPEGTPAYVPPDSAEDYIGVSAAAQPVPVTVDASVYKERDRWIKEEGISARLAEIVLRVAIICASFDGRHTLRGSQLAPALALAKYQASLRSYLKPNPGETLEARATHKLMNYLNRHATDGRWIARRKMYNDIHAQDIGLGVCDRALIAMVHNGYVETGEEGPRGAKVIRLKGAQ